MACETRSTFKIWCYWTLAAASIQIAHGGSDVVLGPDNQMILAAGGTVEKHAWPVGSPEIWTFSPNCRFFRCDGIRGTATPMALVEKFWKMLPFFNSCRFLPDTGRPKFAALDQEGSGGKKRCRRNE